MSSDAPIVILDSSLAGLAVVAAVRRLAPGENLLFLADTARSPLGAKSAQLATHLLTHLATMSRIFSPKQVVVTCDALCAAMNTGSRAPVAGLSTCGIIDASARAAIEAAGALRAPVIAVLAGEASIRSRAYERAIYSRRHHARMLLRPTALIDFLADEGRDENDPFLRTVFKQNLQSIVSRGADVLVLGSASWSTLKPAAHKIVGPDVRVVDSAESCAQDVLRRLQVAGLLRSGSRGWLRCMLSDLPLRYPERARQLLQEPAPVPALWSDDMLSGHVPLRKSA